MQRIDHPDATVANAEGLHDMENGATGLEIEFADGPGARGFGVADATKETLARVFDGVFFDAGIAIALIRYSDARMPARTSPISWNPAASIRRKSTFALIISR